MTHYLRLRFAPAVVHVAVYLYFALPSDPRSEEGIFAMGLILRDSMLIFNPFKKLQFWRYFTYMFIHYSYFHLLSNIAMQIALSIRLERMHKSWRVGLIYALGVFSGALLLVVTREQYTYMGGASSG